MVKEGRLKRYRERFKQYKQNETCQNNENKIYLVVSVYDVENPNLTA